ncbi:flagellar FliJ protein [Azomonas agilis]|uniref:Flagellar FliJ protein n=1 Tax=Azomonas agilis TaxID=116849 RepID=A0A562I2M3_9GAMM|nr:flagellar export protein FliJ [Azomonas agilis]TWH64954.1 flagellar FliJ protein [Azomonas agilis]
MAGSFKERLEPVILMAERAEREAAKRLGQGQAQLAQAAAKLTDLEHYREDYQKRWLEQGKQGVSARWLVNYQHFMTQLDTAINQQQRSVNWYRESLEKLRQQWLQKQARLDGLRKLVARKEAEMRKKLELREQKQLDELSQRRINSYKAED